MNLSLLQKLRLTLSQKKRMLIMGDSHTCYFKEHEFEQKISNRYLHFIQTVGGATISGLSNPNSKTNAQALFEQAFKQVKPHVLIAQIGEVDTGFVIWYRAQKYQASVEEMLERCIKNYRSFLQQYRGSERTIVISAPLPTIKDDQNWGEIANLRKEIQATQAQRTELTVDFNKAVQAVVGELGLDYINMDQDCMGANALVRDDLLHEDPNDHHYARHAYLSLLMPHLETLL